MNRGRMVRVPRLPLLARPNLHALRRPSTRTVAAGCAVVLALSEAVVVFWLSPVVGLSLVLSSTGLGLIFRRQVRDRIRQAEERAAQAARESTDSSHDPDTRLPSRVLLIEQLGREIARARRQSQDLTLATIELSRYEDFRSSWGPAATHAAVLHIAETLRRVTRSADFVARLDAARFGIILAPCNEAQAAAFGDRLSLAVSNRPLPSATEVRVPLYVGVEIVATQYDAERYRGPLDFLSAAGGDLMPETVVTPGSGPAGLSRQPRSLAADPQALRRELVRDYYPDGQAQDFADAYREHRNRARRAI